MAKVIDKKYLYLGLLLAFFLVIIISTCCFAAKTQIENKDDNWVVQSVHDRVVLLNNGEVVEVFEGIAVDTLPESDKRYLERGIPFLTKAEALIAIEDYDG